MVRHFVGFPYGVFSARGMKLGGLVFRFLFGCGRLGTFLCWRGRFRWRVARWMVVRMVGFWGWRQQEGGGGRRSALCRVISQSRVPLRCNKCIILI